MFEETERLSNIRRTECVRNVRMHALPVHLCVTYNKEILNDIQKTKRSEPHRLYKRLGFDLVIYTIGIGIRIAKKKHM